MKHNRIKVLVSLFMMLGVLSCQIVSGEVVQEVLYSNDFESVSDAEVLSYKATGNTSYTVEELNGESYLLLDDQDKGTSLVAAQNFQPATDDELTIAFRFKQPKNLGNTDNTYGNIIISQNGAFLDKNQVEYQDDILVSLYLVGGKLKYKDTNLSGSTQSINSSNYDPNEWHDLKVVVDFNEEEWMLYLDGNNILTRTIKNTISQIDSVTFKTSGKRNNKIFIDDLSMIVEMDNEEEETPPSDPIFQQMRQNYVDYLTGKNGEMLEEDFQDPNVQTFLSDLDTNVSEILQSMDLSSSRTYIWQDLDRIINNGEVWPKGAKDKRSDDTKNTYGRLEKLAIAYETEGSQYFHSDEVKDAIIDALQWLYDNDWYSDGYNVQKGGNSWDWSIGTPNRCLTPLVILYDQIPSELMEDYIRTINVSSHSSMDKSTGANLMWKINKFALCEIIEEDHDELKGVLGRLSSIYNYVTDGDGFYDDGSFIQHHNVSNTGNYGRQLIEFTARVLSYTQSTPWEINADNYGSNTNNIYEVIGQNFEPFMYEGVLMSMVNGRHIASTPNDYDRGYTVMKAVLGFVDAAPEPFKEEFESMLKYWLESDDQREGYNFYSNISPYSIYRVNQILNDESVLTRGPLVGIYNAAGMDRIVQRKNGYAFGIAMASNRVVNGEDTNKENIRGWHLGSGATYLYNSDDNKFSKDYWPLVDAFRIPGTTAINGEEFGMKKSNNSYAGGAVFQDGSDGYGTAGMILDFSNSKLSAKKSWFMFDDEIVAMGSDVVVDYPQNNSVETIIDNYHLKPDASNTVIVDGEEILMVNNADTVAVSENSHVVLDTYSKDNVSWVNYDGNVVNSSVGYYFPTGMSLDMMKDKRSYSYFTINQNTSNTEQNTGNFFTMYKDHGNNPSGDSYVYTILPNKNSEETANYAANPDIAVIAHTDKVHGVKETNTGLTAINFFADEEVTAGPVTANKKCSVIMKEQDGILTLSVSDPTQKNNGYIDLYIDSVGEVINSHERIETIDDTEGIHIRVNTANARGKSFTVQFSVSE